MSVGWTPWMGWTFSSSLQPRVNEFVARLREENRESDKTKNWICVRDFKYKTDASEIEANETLNETIGSASCDVDILVDSTVESLESSYSMLQQCTFTDKPTSLLKMVFSRVQAALTEAGFSNFCKVLSSWQDPKLLGVCFDCVILSKLKSKEEAAFPTITAVAELAQSKPDQVSKCIIHLLMSNHFADEELLQKVFISLPDNEKDSIVMVLVSTEDFKESNWKLLQVLIPYATSSSLHKIITFMSNKSDEYANNQSFARLLVSLCKNLQTDCHKDILLSIIEKNKTLLRRQALKYLMSS